MREFIVITIGAAFGANARYWVANWLARQLGSAFPWGTLFVNVTGGLLIGFLFTLLSARVADPTYRLLLITGFLGAYTTFSSFTYETLRLAEDGAYLSAGLNIAASLLLSLLTTLIGVALARALL